MKLQYADVKLTDELERKLIADEIDHDHGRGESAAGVFVMEVVVGTLLVLGAVLLLSHL